MIFDFANSIGLESWHLVVIIVVAGFLQGFINTMAGAGTVITYSLFVALGMPSNIANGTVRIGVLMQTMISSFKFHKFKKLDFRKGLILGIPIVAGSVFGASLAVNIDKSTFEIIVGVLLTCLLVTMLINPKRWLEGKSADDRRRTSFLQLILFLIVGFYGGFIHIGVGIFLLTALVLNAGYDVVQANAIKVFLVLLYIPVALMIFIINDQVDYLPGIIAAVGNIAGGFIGTNLAVKKGAKFVRSLLMVIIVLFVLKLFGVWNLVF
jgi:uncharacterized protein